MQHDNGILAHTPDDGAGDIMLTITVILLT